MILKSAPGRRRRRRSKKGRFSFLDYCSTMIERTTRFLRVEPLFQIDSIRSRFSSSSSSLLFLLPSPSNSLRLSIFYSWKRGSQSKRTSTHLLSDRVNPVSLRVCEPHALKFSSSFPLLLTSALLSPVPVMDQDQIVSTELSVKAPSNLDKIPEDIAESVIACIRSWAVDEGIEEERKNGRKWVSRWTFLSPYWLWSICRLFKLTLHFLAEQEIRLSELQPHSPRTATVSTLLLC